MDENYFISVVVAALWSAGVLLYAIKSGFFKMPNELNVLEFPMSTSSVLFAFLIFMGTQVSIGSLFPKYAWKDPVAIISSGLALWIYLDLFPKIKSAVWRTKTYISMYHALLNFGFGVMAWFVCYPIVMLLNQLITVGIILLFDKPPSDQLAVELMKGYLDNPYQFWMMATLIVFVVPVIEEMLFRGFLQTRLNRSLGIENSIIFTSIIFSLFHFTAGQGVHNIGIISALFLLSCFLGFIYERQNSLLAPIGLHCSFNAFTVLLIFHDL
jgi:membrane protease YdiL (CAAX protease family)